MFSIHKIIISIVCVFALFFCTIIFVSCSNEIEFDPNTTNSEVVQDNNILSRNSNFIQPNMYGIYHNEILNIYLQKYKSEHNTNFTTIYNKALFEFEKKYPNVISEEEKNFFENRINESLSSLNTINYNSIISTSIINYYSPKLQTLFFDILDKQESTPIVLLQIQTFKTNTTLTEDEIEDLEKFEIVLTSSTEFWTNYYILNPSITNKAACNPKHQLYFADAVGCMFGGIGSIAMSALVDEAQSQNGGGCI